MRTPQPLWMMVVFLGAIVTGSSGGWSGAPWAADVTSAAARSSIKFVIGIAILLIGAYLRYRASRGRASVDIAP